MESTTAVANLIGCVSIYCASGMGFYSGRARLVEVFKLELDAPRLELSSHAQVRTQARTQASARTPNYHGPQTKLKIDVQ